MKKSHSLVLTLGLLTAGFPALAEPVSVTLPLTEQKPSTPSLSPQDIQDIYSVILKHFDTLESILDSIGQALASGASRLDANQKKVIQEALYSTRSQIEIIKQVTLQHVDVQSLYLLAAFVNEVTHTLQYSVDSKLLTFLPATEEGMQKNLQRLNTQTLNGLNQLLQENETSLKKLTKDVDVIGLTKTNLVYRKVRSLAKKYSLYDTAEHAVVYTAFLAWCAWNTSEAAIEELKASPKSRLQRWIGTILSKFKNTGVIPKKSIKGNEQRTHFTKEPNGVPLSEATGFVTCVSSSSFGEPLPNLVDTLLLSINEGAIFNISLAGFFAAYFTNDAKTLYKQCKRIIEHFDNRYYGATKQESLEESTIPKERFKDIVGREEIKAELSKIVEYISHPDRYNRADIKISRGYLLAGSPQTGKTFMARALAGEIADALQATGKTQTVRFFDISTDHLKSNGIAYYINLAKQFAPCILFFDELDLARLQRDGDSGLLSSFLQCMSEGLTTDEKDQVFILGVTNKPSNLDFALLQPGRFSKIIYFEKPTFQHRIDYFKSECTKRCMNINNFDFNALAQLTEGCHFGALKQVIRTACMNAKMEGSAVAQHHFERAIATEVHQIIIGAPELPSHKEHLIAIHQAGKAVASMLLQPEQELCQITVLPVTQQVEEKHVTQQYKWQGTESIEQADRLIRYGDIFAFHTTDSLNLVSQQELLKRCKIILAGNAAQIVAGLDQCVDHTDRKKAFELAKKITLGGLDARDMSRSTSDEQLTQAWALLTATEKEVLALLTPYKASIEKIADALQQYKTLTASQIKKLME